MLKKGHINQELNPNLFDDPELTYHLDSEIVKELNKQLKENPEKILPEVDFLNRDLKK